MRESILENYSIYNPKFNTMDLYDLFTTDDGSFGFPQPTKTKAQLRKEWYERRCVNDYKILTKEIKEDFIFMMKQMLEDTHTQTNYYREGESPKGFFFRNGAYLEVFTSRVSPRGRGWYDAGDNRFPIVVVRTDSLSLYEHDDNWNSWETKPNFFFMLKKIRVVAWDVLKEMKYVSTEFKDSIGASRRFSKISLYQRCDDMLLRVVRRLIPSLKIDRVGGWTFSHDYHSFKVENGKMHYMYQNRPVIMKVGKGIKKMIRVFDMGTGYNDEAIKQATDRMLSLDAEYELVEIDGDEIDTYYNGKSYDDDQDTGSLGNSCMRYNECTNSNFFQVYKDHAKMLILRSADSGLIIGRTLLWEAYVRDSEDGSIIGKTIKVMDRVYCVERMYNKFFDWASANGYYRKRYQTYDNEYSFVPPGGTNGDEISIHMSMDIDLDSYRYVPYMDTFAWGRDGEVRNDDGWGDYSARDTNGDLYREDEDY